MRIVGEIPHPLMKITVFKNEGKFSIKFESGLLEQTYKFRDDDRLQSFDDIKKVIDSIFIEKVAEILRGMYSIKDEAMKRTLAQPQEDEFDNII